MDFIKKFFGIAPPQQHSDGYYYWGFQPPNDNDFEIFEIPLPNGPQHRWHHNDPQSYEQEIREMERQFQEMLAPFHQQPGRFGNVFPRFFKDNHIQVQEIETPAIKADEALDDSPMNSDSILAIMEQDRQGRKSPTQIVPRQDGPSQLFQLPPGFKSFSRSVSIQTTRRPDGVWETRKVVRDEHGNEQVTVTEHPDRPGTGGSSFFSFPDIGNDFPNSPFDQPERDQRGMSMFEKFFGRF